MVTIQNRTNGPLDVSQRRGRGRLAAGAVGTFDPKNLSPGWLDGALARHMVSIVTDAKPARPAVKAPAKADVPPPPPPVDPEKVALLKAAAELGKTVDASMTKEQIIEAMMA